MKKIMIYAYTNYNLGDDLFIKLLCERYPNTQFLFYAQKGYKKTFKDMKNLKVFSSNTLLVRGINFIFRLLKFKSPFLRNIIAKKCDAAVYIGGSLFMQTENWKDKYENKKNMFIENKPFYLLGANFGPYYDKEFYQTYLKLFSKFTDICFRDNYSYSLFKDLPNVRVADDIVFQLSKPEEIKEGRTNTAVISVIKPSIRKQFINQDEIYYKKISEITICLIKKGYKITLMSFCGNEGDEEAVEEILKLLPNEYANNVEKYSYEFNIQEALQKISICDFVVATRFHSMILGWLYDKPVFPIVYSKKMTNVMEDVRFQGSYINLKNIGELNPTDVYNSIDTNLIDIAEQRKRSELHFQELDKLL